MSMHSHTADIHEAGLQDDCPRCEEHASEPWTSLDNVMFTDLIRRTLRNRFGNPHYMKAGVVTDSPYGDYVQPRSDTEAAAMAKVMTMLERFGAFSSVAPDEVFTYLDDRWHVNGFSLS